MLLLAAAVVAGACSKSKTSPDGTGTEFRFISLSATDTVVKVNELTTISAVATGDGLTYNWSASYGTFVGNGATVQWTACHQSRFTINCQVTDQYNHSEKKTIAITAHN